MAQYALGQVGRLRASSSVEEQLRIIHSLGEGA